MSKDSGAKLRGVCVFAYAYIEIHESYVLCKLLGTRHFYYILFRSHMCYGVKIATMHVWGII